MRPSSGKLDEVARPRVGPALHGRVKDRRARAGQLEDDGRGDQLGRPEGVCAGLGGRRRRPEGRHRHPRDRHAGGGEHERRLDRILVHDERRDRADEVAQHRPAPQLLGTAGDHGGHLHGVASFALAVHHPLQVLDGVVPAGIELVQLRRLAAVAGAQRRPPERDARERVLQARHVGQVRLGGLAALPRLEVDDLDAAPVRGAVGAAVADGDVAARVAGAEGEAPRRRRHRLEHEGRRQPGDLGRPVHGGPGLLEQVQRLGALEADAHRLEDVQRGLLEAVELLRRVIVARERRLDGLDRRSVHGCHARLPVAVGHSYQTGAPASPDRQSLQGFRPSLGEVRAGRLGRPTREKRRGRNTSAMAARQCSTSSPSRRDPLAPWDGRLVRSRHARARPRPRRRDPAAGHRQPGLRKRPHRPRPLRRSSPRYAAPSGISMWPRRVAAATRPHWRPRPPATVARW